MNHLSHSVKATLIASEVMKCSHLNLSSDLCMYKDFPPHCQKATKKGENSRRFESPHVLLMPYSSTAGSFFWVNSVMFLLRTGILSAIRSFVVNSAQYQG